MTDSIFRYTVCLFLLSVNIFLGFIFYEIKTRIIGVDDFNAMSVKEKQEAARLVPFVRVHGGSLDVEVTNTMAIPVEIER